MDIAATKAQFARAIALHQRYMAAPSAARLPQLLEAVQLYEGLLAVITERDFPAQWAATQNNLATAYKDLPTGDRVRNIEVEVRRRGGTPGNPQSGC